jgi:hypothetical protein
MLFWVVETFKLRTSNKLDKGIFCHISVVENGNKFHEILWERNYHFLSDRVTNIKFILMSEVEPRKKEFKFIYFRTFSFKNRFKHKLFVLTKASLICDYGIYTDADSLFVGDRMKMIKLTMENEQGLKMWPDIKSKTYIDDYTYSYLNLTKSESIEADSGQFLLNFKLIDTNFLLNAMIHFDELHEHMKEDKDLLRLYYQYHFGRSIKFESENIVNLGYITGNEFKYLAFGHVCSWDSNIICFIHYTSHPKDISRIIREITHYKIFKKDGLSEIRFGVNVSSDVFEIYKLGSIYHL